MTFPVHLTSDPGVYLRNHLRLGHAMSHVQDSVYVYHSRGGVALVRLYAVFLRTGKKGCEILRLLLLVLLAYVHFSYS